MMKRSALLSLIIILIGGCSSVGLEGLSPHLGMLTTAATAAHKASRPITDEEEYYVGRAVAARLLSSYPLSKDKRITEYVNHIGRTIALHSDKPYTHGGYHFAILEGDEANAFACPGGIIFITKVMLKTAKNEDELAAVLAHEIAHVSHRDGISSIKKSRWTEALTIIGSHAAKEYGSQELSQLVGIFEGSIDDVIKTLVVNGYSKSQEYDADKKALSYLTKAGYNPESLKDFLDKLAGYGKGSGGGILKTHPATSDRIENVKENLPSAKANPLSINKRAERFNKSF